MSQQKRCVSWLIGSALVIAAMSGSAEQRVPVQRDRWPVAEIARAGRASTGGVNGLFAGWTDAEIAQYFHRWNAMNHATGDAARRLNMAHGFQETFIFAERVLNEMVADRTITRAQARAIAESGALWRASYATGNTLWDLQGGPGGNASAQARLTPAQETACRAYWRRVIADEAATPRAAATAARCFALSLVGPEIIDSIRERLSGRPTDEVDHARSEFYVLAGTLAYQHFRALPVRHQVAIGGFLRGAVGAAGEGAVRVALPAGLVITAVGLIPPAILRARNLQERVERWNSTREQEMNSPIPRRGETVPGGTVLENGGRRIKVPHYWQLPANQRERFGWIVIYGPSVDQVAEPLWRRYVQNVDQNTPQGRADALQNLLRIIDIAAQPRRERELN